MRQYGVNDIFYSIQGEGVNAGRPALFLRLAGCNLRCDMQPGPQSPGGFRCDTEFVSSRPMSADDILERFRELTTTRPLVILTGGEPALQADASLVASLQHAGYEVAIETNGTVDVSGLGLSWIAVSPKTAEHTLRQKEANEVKYVRSYGQGIPHPAVEADHFLISPAFDGGVLEAKTLAWCVKLVKDNPLWRLSVQIHQLLRLP